MRAPLKKEDYPRYFKTGSVILAFISPSEMYKIENIGSNRGNEGITIDHYKTRKMVLYYWPFEYYKTEVTETEFKRFYNRLFQLLLEKIVS